MSLNHIFNKLYGILTLVYMENTTSKQDNIPKLPSSSDSTQIWQQ